MLVVVTTVSSLVHVYSIGYMAHDPHRPRFFAYLSMFTFAMLALVTADNLVQLVLRLGGRRPRLLSAHRLLVPAAGRQCRRDQGLHRQPRRRFRLRRSASSDLRPVQLGRVTRRSSPMPRACGTKLHFLSWDFDALTVICLLLFMGAMGKSAQFLLHTWLPDAHGGPDAGLGADPRGDDGDRRRVHGGAAVAAVRAVADRACVVVFFGATTAFFAATVGLVQNDIKRVSPIRPARSSATCSSASASAPIRPACSTSSPTPSSRRCCSSAPARSSTPCRDEQDMRKMGGLRTFIPVTYWMMVIGTLSLTGFPFTAGYLLQGLDHRGGLRLGQSARHLRLRHDASSRRCSPPSIRGG